MSLARVWTLWKETFDCYLRHSELSSLRVRDVAFDGDPRLLLRGGRAGAAILLRSTKAGRDQWVTVRDPCVVALLRELVTGRS